MSRQSVSHVTATCYPDGEGAGSRVALVQSRISLTPRRAGRYGKMRSNVIYGESPVCLWRVYGETRPCAGADSRAYVNLSQFVPGL
jgi:hypothetical protein